MTTTFCLLTFGDYLAYFRRCLENLLANTPLKGAELRLGFNQAEESFHYAMGLLAPAGCWPGYCLLPEGVERFGWTGERTLGGMLSRRLDQGLLPCNSGRESMAPKGENNLRVWAWNSPANLFKEPMARLLFHDVPLESDYTIWFDDDSFVEPGWWEELCPLLEKKIDYIGQEWWVDYLPGQVDMVQAQPWYLGVPLRHREGKPGVAFMTGGFLAVRTERLVQVNYPDLGSCWRGDRLRQYGGDTLLGEIANQQGWSRAHHSKGVQINVDLEGNHPAPRRSEFGRQFGAAVDVAIR